MATKPCKYCGRTGSLIHNSSNPEVRNAEKCIYCKGRGFIYTNNQKEVEK